MNTVEQQAVNDIKNIGVVEGYQALLEVIEENKDKVTVDLIIDAIKNKIQER